MNEKIKKPFFSLLIGFFLLAIAFVVAFYIGLTLEAKANEKTAALSILVGIVGIILFVLPIALPSLLGAILSVLWLVKKRFSKKKLILLTVLTFIPTVGFAVTGFALLSPFLLAAFFFGIAMLVFEIVVLKKMKS